MEALRLERSRSRGVPRLDFVLKMRFQVVGMRSQLVTQPFLQPHGKRDAGGGDSALSRIAQARTLVQARVVPGASSQLTSSPTRTAVSSFVTVQRVFWGGAGCQSGTVQPRPSQLSASSCSVCVPGACGHCGNVPNHRDFLTSLRCSGSPPTSRVTDVSLRRLRLIATCHAQKRPALIPQSTSHRFDLCVCLVSLERWWNLFLAVLSTLAARVVFALALALDVSAIAFLKTDTSTGTRSEPPRGVVKLKRLAPRLLFRLLALRVNPEETSMQLVAAMQEGVSSAKNAVVNDCTPETYSHRIMFLGETTTTCTQDNLNHISFRA